MAPGVWPQAFVRPARVLGIAIALALVGFVADTQTRVVSDITRLVPSDLPAVRDLETLQRTTGVARADRRDGLGPRPGRSAGVEVDVRRTRAGCSGGSATATSATSDVSGCGQAALCPALSLTNLFAARLHA